MCVKEGRFSTKAGWQFHFFFAAGITLPVCEVLCVLFLTVHCTEEIQTVLIGLSMLSLSGWVLEPILLLCDLLYQSVKSVDLCCYMTGITR